MPAAVSVFSDRLFELRDGPFRFPSLEVRLAECSARIQKIAVDLDRGLEVGDGASRLLSAAEGDTVKEVEFGRRWFANDRVFEEGERRSAIVAAAQRERQLPRNFGVFGREPQRLLPLRGCL